jgi:hypothetical protein
MYNKQKEPNLLGAGWQPLNRDIDLNYLWQIWSNNPWEVSHKVLDVVSYIADALGRENYTWWANFFSLFYENTREEIDDFWNFITPEPLTPDSRYKDSLSIETPIVKSVTRDLIPLEHVLLKLQEIIVSKLLSFLGRPDLITQYSTGKYFYYPTEKFVDWNKLKSIGSIFAYWSEHEIWLRIDPLYSMERDRRYTIMAKKLAPLVNKVTYDLAVMLSGYQSRIGQVHSQFSISSFPIEVQNFTDAVQEKVFTQERLAVLVYGNPGTGKTAWTQAVGKEVLAPLRYIIFILDHAAVENFVPPSYLERVCIIINEADNLAPDRSTEVAQLNYKTERILSLLDGTLYQSVIDSSGIQEQQKLVVLMTCNTTERLDPAMLRKGRIDLICEFTHQFV